MPVADHERLGAPSWGDFGGTCLIGEFTASTELLLPASRVFGIPKSASYLYGTWRDEDGVMYRALRGVGATLSDFAFLFSAEGRTQIARVDVELFQGSVAIRRDGDDVEFCSVGAGPGNAFEFRHTEAGCWWREGDELEMAGTLLGPGVQWFHPWRDGGGCYTASTKYASDGMFRGRRVTGFIGHEIHYMPEGRDWFNTPYGRGMEICWQQVANQYDDGSFVHGTFGYGTDGWRFAMLHDETGTFTATTDVQMEAVVRDNGYPERITYTLPDGRWIWTIDRFGERAKTIDGAPLGADGTCVKDGETRTVVRSMGNSDWWADGRYEASRRGFRVR
jgi:hypothetical protein